MYIPISGIIVFLVLQVLLYVTICMSFHTIEVYRNGWKETLDAWSESTNSLIKTLDMSPDDEVFKKSSDTPKGVKDNQPY